MHFKYITASAMIGLIAISCVASAGNQDPKDIRFKGGRPVGESSYLFLTPSLKIGCFLEYSNKYLNCRRDDYFTVTLYRKGNAVEEMMDSNIGILDDPKFYMQAPVLRYGTWWSNHYFACFSEEAGVTCKNREGNGFFLSSEKFEPKHIPENF